MDDSHGDAGEWVIGRTLSDSCLPMDRADRWAFEALALARAVAGLRGGELQQMLGLLSTRVASG